PRCVRNPCDLSRLAFSGLTTAISRGATGGDEPCFILWEGNDGPGLAADNIHGSSHFITAFRNVWLGWETGKTQETIPIHLEAWNRYYNFIGNVVGKIGYHTRYEAAASSPTDPGNASVGDTSASKTGGILNVNAANCYPATATPAAPTNLRIVRSESH